jgi:hypothetical protein
MRLRENYGHLPKGQGWSRQILKDYLERAHDLSNRLAHFLAERNARRKAAREQRHGGKGASSSRAAGRST